MYFLKFVPRTFFGAYPAIYISNLRRISSIQNQNNSNIPGLEITSNAIKQIHKIYERDKNPNQALRIFVDMGGCHGFQYKFELVDVLTKNEKTDNLIEKDGAKVLIDSISLDLIRNAKVDFRDELIAQCFQIVDIPRASTHCGCGTSFQIKE